MRPWTVLCALPGLVFLSSSIGFTAANVEKIVFSQRTLDNLPTHPHGRDARVEAASFLSSQTPWESGVHLPQYIVPRHQGALDGAPTYYHVERLSDPQSSYEVRVCWPATFPVNWSLDLIKINHTTTVLRVQADYAGVMHTGSLKTAGAVTPYAIVLERLVLHAIPVSTIPVIAGIIGTLILGIIFVLPLVQANFKMSPAKSR
ncbi:hypothetical protein DFJ77DRAFT_272061 [Powellomyces hirtus]|nr:hypothetical protein DFJ77DRAFT_272061 [Powellomyces hirtus]